MRTSNLKYILSMELSCPKLFYNLGHLRYAIIAFSDLLKGLNLNNNARIFFFYFMQEHFPPNEEENGIF